MQQLGSLHAPGVVTISLLLSDDFNGCRWDSVSTSSWLSASIWRCITLRHSTWSRTASSSQTLVDANYDLRTSTPVLSRIQEHTLVTGAFRLLARGRGPV